MEVFFYAIFALALFLSRNLRILFLASVLVSLTLCGIFWPQVGNPVFAMYTNPLLIEFLAGACIGRLFTEERRAQRRIVTMVVIVAVTTLSIFAHRLIFGAVAIVIVVAALSLEKRRLMPRFPVLLFLGNASYSIYLFQQIGFDLTETALNALNTDLSRNVLYKLLAIVAAIGLGAIMHVAIEKPLTQQVRLFLTSFASMRATLRHERPPSK